MKKLLLSTAMVIATAGAALTQAAAPAPGAAVVETETTATIPASNVPGFRATEFTGMNLYALNPDVVTDLRGAQPAPGGWDERTARWTSTDTFIAGRDKWEDVGAINDIILSQDGAVQGVLLDVGGFLGIGARTVMIDIDNLYFVADTATPEDLGDFFVVAGLSRAQLEALPEWNDDNLTAGYAWEGAALDMTGTEAPVASAEGTVTADPMAGSMAAAPTAEELTGSDVTDMAGKSIGNVSDIVLDGDRVAGAVIDVGGFLGMGTHSVVVPVEDLVVVRDEDRSILRIETALTREQLEAMPPHDEV
ncbi:PRC-barrel domain-containing protein [Gemmobacter sp.]|uniref:PRC-barrel domain-containing protein n=1 Tax=Gemmobacter sp. TaxID=1898957 RepID=UPI002B001CD4|nr:PRC-barrel domain-containing protein [Gemmobacter sp.]